MAKSCGFPRDSSSDRGQRSGNHKMTPWRAIRRRPILFATFIFVGLTLLTIPNLSNRWCGACESAAIGNLRALAESLERYRSTSHSYPDAWLDDLYTTVDPDLGPPSFGIDLQTKAQTVVGYMLRYTPQPPGCTGTACRGYTLTAIPHPPRMWLWMVAHGFGTRSFFVDESGIFRQCVGGTGAEATDSTIDAAPKPC